MKFMTVCSGGRKKFMIDFDHLWEELYFSITLEECESIIKQVQSVRDNSVKMLEQLVELRSTLREAKDAHNQLDGGTT